MTEPSATAAAPPVTFRSIGAQNRREVFALARRGEIHDDLPVAVAAYRWSHAKRWGSRANRLPGWILPAVGVAYVVLGVVTGLPFIFSVGGLLVIFCGVMGWIATSRARRLRAVYAAQSEQPAAEQEPHLASE